MSAFLASAIFVLFRLSRNLYFHIAVTVPFFLAQGLTLTQIFTLESIYYIAKVVADVPAGAFADNVSKRWSVALSGFLAAIGYVLMGSVDWFWGFAIAQFILGVAVALFSGADSTAVLDILQKEGKDSWYPKVESWGWAARNLGFGIGAIGGGFIASSYGAGVTWYITAVFVFLSGVLILMYPDDRQKAKATNRRTVIELLKEVGGFMRQDMFVAGVLIYFATVFSLVRIGLWFLQPMAQELGLDISMNGILFFGSILISILFGALSSRIFPVEKVFRSLVVVTVIGIVFPVLWGWSSISKDSMIVWGAFAVGFIMYGALQGLYDPVAKIWVAVRIPAGIRTTVLSTGSLVANLVFAGIAPLSGYFADMYGIGVSLMIMALIHAVALVMASFFLLRGMAGTEIRVD